MKREWLDNPFWDNPEKTLIKAILKTTDSQGRVTHQVITLQEKNPDDPSDFNPDWKEVVEQIGIDKIDQNTLDREENRKREEEAKLAKEEQLKKADHLQRLFKLKLEAFEIEEVKNSNNRELKGKLRRAKSSIEVNIFAMMIVMEAMDNDNKPKTE